VYAVQHKMKCFKC